MLVRNAVVSSLLAAATVRVPIHPVRVPTGNLQLNVIDEAPLLMDELNIKCCQGRLEAHPALEMPRLALRAQPASIDESDLKQMIDMLCETLDRREPFTVLWDLRQMRPPSRAALRYAMDWFGKPENSGPADELVQSTVIISGSAVIRGLCGWILKVCNPPRPVEICKDDEAALAAARRFGFAEAHAEP